MFQSFLTKIKFLSILMCFVWQTDAQVNVSWSCATDVNGYPYDLQNISGIWYEAARMPASVVPACVQVNVPNQIVNETLDLQLNYINNVNNKWKPTEENLTFPWNDETKNGVFQIRYGSGEVSANFTFKLIVTDYKSLALICYYTNYAPSLSMIKIMTRKQQLDPITIDTLQEFIDLQGMGSQITWVEQSERCNSAQSILPTMSFLLLFLCATIRKVF